jgi:CDP-2,3-bis-(O-geranylgeranyl)-sn-glycerol synthase
MCGDLMSSFMKRRLGIKSGDSALGLDQSLEALTPAIMLRTPFAFQIKEIVIVVLAFFLLEICLSRLLYRLRIRDRPL